MDDYFSETGIELDAIPPYTPELNGIAERMNRTLVGAVRSMLIHAKMPKTFWAEALAHIADLSTRMIYPSTNSCNVYERVTGNKPRMDHIRVFGCIEFAHIPKNIREELDDTSRKGVVIACYENSLYKIWCPTKKEPFLSRHVTILEKQFAPAEWFCDEQNAMELSLSDRVDQPSASPDSGTRTNSALEINPHLSEKKLVTYVPEQPSAFDSDSREIEEVQVANEEEVEIENEVNENNSEGQEVNIEKERGDESSNHDAPTASTLTSRYPRRERAQVRFFDPSFANAAFENCEPVTIQEAMQSSEASRWKAATESELSSLQKHGTWEIRKLPEGRKILNTRFVLKRNMLPDGNIARYKARLVVKVFMQGSVEFTYAPVVDFSIIRLALTVAVQRKYLIHQMDVVTAFLHGKID